MSIIGQSNPIQQHDDNSCAIKSQQIILQEFGVPVSEEQLISWSAEHGLYDGTGTSSENVGILLNQGGIPTTSIQNANIFDLTNQLAQGHKVIVGVDSGELWDGGIREWWEDIWEDGQADHALIVAGIDNSDPNNPMVLLTDPGNGTLCKEYPLEQFMDAWKDSNCFMVSTDIAPSDFTAHQVNNGDSPLHLSTIANKSFHDFQLFNDMSNALPDISIWNAPYHEYPIGSLVDAYLDYGHDSISLNDISDYSFADHLNTDLFVGSYADSYFNNGHYISDNNGIDISHINNGILSTDNVDTLHDYFEGLYTESLNMGDIESASFFQQQVNFIECCHELHIDPIGAYADIIHTY